MDSEQLEVIQLLDKDIDLLKKGIREERGKLPDDIKTSFSESQLADPNMLDLFVDLLQLSRQRLIGPQSRAASRDKSAPLQAWPVLEVVPDARPSPLLVQCRTCARMLRAEVFHEHVTGCQSRAESRGESRSAIANRTRDNSPAPRHEDSEDSGAEERSRDHVSERASQEVTRDMSTVARDLSPLARELVKKIGVEHSKRKRDAETEDEGPKKRRKLSNEPMPLPKKEIATTVEVTPAVNQTPGHVAAPTAMDTWTSEEHDTRPTVKKMLMSKNGNKSAEDVKELLQFIKSVPPRPLVFTNDDDELYFWHQSRTPSALPVASRAARDRRAHRLREAGVSVSALPSSELVRSEYRYSVPNRLLKLSAQQVLLQQTVKIALLSGLLHQNEVAANAGNKQLRSSKGRVRANNSSATPPPPPPSSTAAPVAASEKSGAKTSDVPPESEPVDEKSLLAKLLQLEPSAPATNSATAGNTGASSVPPTANNSNNVSAVSTPVPVTTAPSTSIAVPATPVTVTPVTAVTPTPATAKSGHVPTALLVPNSALSASLMKDIALKGKTGSGVPLTAVTLLHTQLQGANIKMQVKGKVPAVAQPKTGPPPTGVKVAPTPISVLPKQISPKPAVKQPTLLAKPMVDSAGNRVAVVPIASVNTSALMRPSTQSGLVVSSMPVVLTTAKPLVAPPTAVVPPTVPAKKSAAKK